MSENLESEQGPEPSDNVRVPSLEMPDIPHLAVTVEKEKQEENENSLDVAKSSQVSEPLEVSHIAQDSEAEKQMSMSQHIEEEKPVARSTRSVSGAATATSHTSRAEGGNGRTPRARRMNLSITRLDPWSVAKVTFMLSVALGIVQVVAAGLMWLLLQAVGVFDQVTQIISSAGLDAGSFNLADVFSISTVLSAVTIFSIIEVVLFTILMAILSLLYNVVSSLVGGVHITLGDD